MRDVALIADALAESRARGESVVLATVVRTEGSTYRRAGARMLLRRGGGATGAVSGGCLEADLAARVDDVLAADRPEVVTYDTRSGDDLVWGLGLGCNGRVDVLLEPLGGAALARAEALHAWCRDVGAAVVLSTVIAGDDEAGPRIGDRMAVGASAPGGVAIEGAPPEVIADAWETLQARRSVLRAYAGPGARAFEVLHEVVTPAVALLVCGAGVDVVPLAALAAGLGWRVTVADHRPDHARPERFPRARVVALDDVTTVDDLARDGCDAAVVMSHHYERDLAHVRALLAAGVTYVGVLGPRRRTERMVAELGASDADAARLHAPVGLDIGAETPDEIALAIVAEVQAVRTGRRGTPLRERPGGIHDEPPASRHAAAPVTHAALRCAT